MPKHLLALVFCLFLFTTAFAQKGGLTYYLNNAGNLVSTKDSADYSMVVMPPDTSVDKNLYVVYEYYKNGKLKLLANSKTNDINLQFQGRYIKYFPNGRKKIIGMVENGNPIGDEINYYPNGKVYSTKKHLPDGKIFFGDCRDSTGDVLTENGKGKWIQYNDDFTKMLAEGNIENGKKEGQWHGIFNDNVNFKSFYHQGDIMSFDTFDRPGADKVFSAVEVVPEFPGGKEALFRFLNSSFRYPADARKRKIRGGVVVNFIVETDGTLTNIKVYKVVDKSIDDEALRVMKLSPPWKPGFQNGRPVRVAYSVPVSFALTN